jgi:hypothetical protein
VHKFLLLRKEPSQAWRIITEINLRKRRFGDTQRNSQFLRRIEQRENPFLLQKLLHRHRARRSRAVIYNQKQRKCAHGIAGTANKLERLVDMRSPAETRGIHREQRVLLPPFVDAYSISGRRAREYPQTETGLPGDPCGSGSKSCFGAQKQARRTRW